MSDYIPFDIQSEIIKWLPAKSLLRFRTVSKEWKTHIDTNHKPHLLVSYELDNVRRYASIIDNNTFPRQMIPLTPPESLSSLRKPLTLTSDAGLLCFYGDVVDSNTKRAVIWNPTVGKSVGINVILKEEYMHTVVGFGVCSHDPMLVKIGVKANKDGRPTWWDVDVFSLSTREWRNVYEGAPFKSCKLECAKVCVNGVIYFRAYDLPVTGYIEDRSNFFISLDLERMEFGEVPLPGSLVHTLDWLQAAKVNGSLGLLQYHAEVCDVWTRKDGANKPFTNIYTVKVDSKSVRGNVLGFRNNGDAVIELEENNEKSVIKVYKPSLKKNKPSSGHVSDVGIEGRPQTFSVRSYMKTALLLDQPESDIIH